MIASLFRKEPLVRIFRSSPSRRHSAALVALNFVALSLLAAITHAQLPPIFVLRGALDDPSTIDTGSAFKEFELEDLNGDGRLDLYLPAKQPGSANESGENLNILYLSNNGDLILAVDDPGLKFFLVPTEEAFDDPPGLPPLMTSRAYDAEIADFDFAEAGPQSGL